LNTLTDNKLAQLYVKLSEDYQRLREERDFKDIDDIIKELYEQFYAEISTEGNSLYSLDGKEKTKAWRVFDAFRQMLYDTYFDKSGEQLLLTTLSLHQQRGEQIIVMRHKNHYVSDGSTDLFRDLLFLNFFISRDSSSHSNSSSNHHRHKSEEDNDSWVKIFAILALIILGVSAAIITACTLLYITKHLIESMERFFYNEGCLQAFINLLATLAGAAAGAALGVYVVAAPLMGLALLAGITNPIGIAIVGIVVLALFGSALSLGLVNFLQTTVIKHTNPDALDPGDPYRYRLTDAEIRNLEKSTDDRKEICPIATKCAIVVLRQKINQLDQDSSKYAPDLYNRFTSTGREKQECLRKIRQLRSGALTDDEIQDFVVGELHFNLNHIPEEKYDPTLIKGYDDSNSFKR
jgi:hypothetical protein